MNRGEAVHDPVCNAVQERGPRSDRQSRLERVNMKTRLVVSILSLVRARTGDNEDAIAIGGS